MEKFVSRVTSSPLPAQFLYARLSSLQGLSQLVNIPEVENVQATDDTCTFTAKGMPVGLQVVERVPYSTLKYQAMPESPFQFTFWVQLKEVSASDTRLRLTLHAQIPLMLRLMLKGKIQKGLDEMAKRLANMGR